MAQVVLEQIYKTYQKGTPDHSEKSAVLRSINLLIEDGEFMVLVGPSGCGKSTLLRLIAGLEDLSAGTIRVSDRVVNDLPPKERDIAMVFQNYALYPHMSVYDNLAFGLRRTQLAGQAASWTDNLLVGATRNLPPRLQYLSDRERAVRDRVKLVAQMLQIEPLLKRLPKQLSGGQKQRVALGRAMARNPQVFLMDEPLSNLDAKLRAETRAQIVKLQRQLGTTTIYVTHDQTEAMTMGDRIAVMNAGQIQQLATPLELYKRPANRFVAEFIGSPPMNFLPVQVRAPSVLHHALFRLTLPQAWEPVLKPYDGQMVTLGIRPEHLSLSPPSDQAIPVKVDLVEALGSETYLSVRLSDGSDAMQVRTEPDRAVKLGEPLWLSISPEQIQVFDRDTGVALRADTI
ncbi:ATP-binding cassette domain-containing protein [Myxacorys almedinensis]|uniref:ATP-binding cassette domain-containing protein n=1 Tax=Myxacorys almedinensis A TaxID=2690445 RepID=A0A8J7Z905_9CYAN|nr:ATP-binding cassette domain-containing protein [Myxacorys almedinensis A]